MTRYLIVAHQTAESDELRRCVIDVTRGDASAECVLLVPATPVNELLMWDETRSAERARRRGDAARSALEAAGITIADVRIGDGDPHTAIGDELRTDGLFGVIVLSTLPPGASRWLRMDLLTRVRRLAPQSRVVHVVTSVRTAVPA